MNTTPSLDDLLAGVIAGLHDDIMPALENPKAMSTAMMMQSILQGVRQLLPVHDAHLIDEHNGMIATLRAAAETLGDAPGEAADRVRARAATLGRQPDLPPALDREAAVAAHRELGAALESTLRDLDELQRAGVDAADAALVDVRTHLGPRFARDVATFMVGEGFVGRG